MELLKQDKCSYTFNELLSDILQRLPVGWKVLSWSYDRILIAECKEMIDSRKLLIEKNMSIKLFINSVQVKSRSIKAIRSLGSVFFNLSLLKNLKLCPGVDEFTRSEICSKYTEINEKNDRCLSCRLLRRKITDRNIVRQKRKKLSLSRNNSKNKIDVIENKNDSLRNNSEEEKIQVSSVPLNQENGHTYTYGELLRDTLQKLPNGWKALPLRTERILIGEWSKMIDNPKTLLIEKDMTVKAYVNGVRVILPEITNIHCHENITDNLKILENFKLCPGVDKDTRSETCSGYMKLKGESERCLSCLRIIEEKAAIQRETETKP